MKKVTLAFYNTENFFDPAEPSARKAKEFSPKGKKRWTQNKYRNKVSRIAEVLSQIGKEETGEPPLIIGLAEVENARVLSDLVRSPHLAPFEYDFVHYKSKDERGMDTAMLYRKERADLISSQPIPCVLDCADSTQEFTRDILYTRVNMSGHEFHLFFLHLPSRRKTRRFKDFRALVLESLHLEIQKIAEKDPKARIILSGDFNCSPGDEQLQRILNIGNEKTLDENRFYNPFLNFPPGAGTSKYNGRWYLFDQIVFSKSLIDTVKEGPSLDFAGIYNPPFLRQPHPKAKGAPFRTYFGRKYLGGYSDHFPVYAILNC